MKPKATTPHNLSMPPGEERRPLAVIFYDAEKDKLNFDRMAGVKLEEFAAIYGALVP